MKKILCFGDSNVYGFNPKNGQRYSKDCRWSGILQSSCKNKYDIIEAGCNNRTCFKDNPAGIEQTGYKILPTILSETKPNSIILALGINDLQFQYNTTPTEIELGLTNIIKTTQKICPNAKIIILSPSNIKKCILQSFFSAMFDQTSIELSKQMSKIYKNVADTQNCLFLDLNKIATTSDIDGLHYTIDEHKKIAQKVFEFIDNHENLL